MDKLNNLDKHNGLLTIRLNTRSVWKKIDSIRNVFVDRKIDLITLSKTWLTADMPDEMIDINGYNIIRR